MTWRMPQTWHFFEDQARLQGLWARQGVNIHFVKGTDSYENLDALFMASASLPILAIHRSTSS
jgi:hypothetical protein